jgi:hypothetical protein
MDFEKEILAEHSKKQTLKIVEFIGKDQDKFNNLIKLFFNKSPLISQRTSWVVSYCVTCNPELINFHLSKIVKNLQHPIHVAVKRHTLHILQDIDIPKKLHGEIVNTCFKFLNDNSSTVAIKALSISVLYKVCLSEPELMRELKIIIENQMPYSSPAFTSRGKKILEKINKKGL